MSKPAFLLLDTKDDRREIHSLLSRLAPDDRLRFLDECCRKVFLPGSRINPRPSPKIMLPLVKAAQRDDAASEKLTNSVLLDLYTLANTYRLDLKSVAIDLERLVKAKSKA